MATAEIEEEYRELQQLLESASSGPSLDPGDMWIDPHDDVVDSSGLDDCEIEVLDDEEDDQ